MTWTQIGTAVDDRAHPDDPATHYVWHNPTAGAYAITSTPFAPNNTSGYPTLNGALAARNLRMMKK